MFNLEATVNEWRVQVDTEDQSGVFENVETGAAGTLLFDSAARDSDAELELSDYEGVGFLPEGVAAGLRDLGVLVDADFE